MFQSSVAGSTFAQQYLSSHPVLASIIQDAVHSVCLQLHGLDVVRSYCRLGRSLGQVVTPFAILPGLTCLPQGGLELADGLLILLQFLLEAFDLSICDRQIL